MNHDCSRTPDLNEIADMGSGGPFGGLSEE